MTRFPQSRFATRRSLAAARSLTVAGTIAATAALTGPAIAQPVDALEPTIAAHGGWNAWNEQRTLTYDAIDWPLGVQPEFSHTADLRSRYHRAESATYTSGIAGGEAWLAPAPGIEAGTDPLGLPPAFFLHGNFYFHAMPFVFADPGVNVRPLGPGELFGETYDRLGVSFGAGVGDTNDDDYILFVDPDTRRLAAINFSITHDAVRGDAAIADAPRKVLVFNAWQDVDGLLLPETLTFHAVEGGEVASDGATYRITNVGLSTEAPDPSIFVDPGETDEG